MLVADIIFRLILLAMPLPSFFLPSYITHPNTFQPATSKQIVFNGARDKHEIALTFDADMTKDMKNMLREKRVASWNDGRIVKYLTSNNIKATFFLTGLWAQIYADETKEIANNPLFEIANHTFTHRSFQPDCFRLEPVNSRQEKIYEILKTQEVISDFTGDAPRYFRFPGGCYSKEDVELISMLGLTPVQWDTVSADAFNGNTENIVNNIAKVQNGSIVVLHLSGGINAPKTFEALTIAIPQIQEKGFRFVTLTELLAGSSFAKH